VPQFPAITDGEHSRRPGVGATALRSASQKWNGHVIAGHFDQHPADDQQEAIRDEAVRHRD